MIFQMPVGDEKFVMAKLREKATQVEKTIARYVKDLEVEYPQELWT